MTSWFQSHRRRVRFADIFSCCQCYRHRNFSRLWSSPGVSRTKSVERVWAMYGQQGIGLSSFFLGHVHWKSYVWLAGCGPIYSFFLGHDIWKIPGKCANWVPSGSQKSLVAKIKLICVTWYSSRLCEPLQHFKFVARWQFRENCKLITHFP